MEIVYFGSDVFLSCFDYLSEHHHIRALYTYHNDEDYFTEFAITKRAEELGIPIHYEAISPLTTKEYFNSGVDMFFVAEYDRIIEIPEDLPDFKGTNLHSSALPEGRSYYPIEVAMQLNLPRTGVTLHKLKPKLDSGAIIDQRVFDITPEMDSIDVYLRCASYGREMTEAFFKNFNSEWNKAHKQMERLPYWKRPATENLTLNHDMSIKEASEVFRRYNNMTEVSLNGKPYYVTSMMTGKSELLKPEIQLSDNLWLYSVKSGNLRLNVYPIKEKE